MVLTRNVHPEQSPLRKHVKDARIPKLDDAGYDLQRCVANVGEGRPHSTVRSQLAAISRRGNSGIGAHCVQMGTSGSPLGARTQHR